MHQRMLRHIAHSSVMVMTTAVLYLLIFVLMLAASYDHAWTGLNPGSSLYAVHRTILPNWC